MAKPAKMTLCADVGYRTNKALDRHTASAHEGTVDPNCPACIEIQAKMARLREDDASEVKQASEVSGVL